MSDPVAPPMPAAQPAPAGEQPSRAPVLPPAPSRSGLLGTLVWIGGTVLVTAAVIVAIAYFAVGRKTYSQGSPDDVLASAIQMVKDGNAERLPDLVWADNVEYRATLTRLGKLCGTMQDLGTAVAQKFPQEVEALREKIKAESEGKGDSILAALNSRGGAIQFRQPRTPEEQDAQRARFEDLTARLWADPFGWLAQGAGRLSTKRTADDTAVLLFDGDPMLAGIIQMKLYNGRWWILLPLNLPGVSQYSPQTRNEWLIVASLIKVIDNAMGELVADVRAGKAQRLDDLARLAGEKAFIPAAIVFVMYGKEMDVRQSRERAMAAFRRRWREFERPRHEDFSTMKVLYDAVDKAAVESLDKLIRARIADKAAPPVPKFDGMPQAEFVPLVEKFLTEQGAKDLKLGDTVTKAQAEKAVADIEKTARSGIRSKPAPVAK